MNLFDLINMGLKNLFRRKVRTILTVLGVVIGTAAIVVMLSLGIGMNESYKKDISRMGSLNIINVDGYYFPEGGMVSGPIQRKVMDDSTVAKISQIEGVEAVTPMMNQYLKFVSGKYVANINVMGIDPDKMKDFDFNLGEGRLLLKEDNEAIVFGQSIAQMFMDSKSSSRGGIMYMGGMGGGNVKPKVDLLKDKLEMTFDMSYGERKSLSAMLGQGSNENNNKPAKIYKVKGVGVLAQSFNQKDWSAYMSIHYLKKLQQEYSRSQNSQQGARRVSSSSDQGYEQIMVKVKDIKDVEKIQKSINEMGYGASSLADMLKSVKKTSSTMQTVLGGIGAISLLVAALGITNTMTMSIYERTREIGVMKVLGCLLGDIKKLFLFEAGMIGAMGGIAGALLSYGASFIVNMVGSGVMGRMVPGEEPNPISVIPLWLTLAAMGFAVLIGLVSGFFPARRAMKLSALEAIKTE